jgi:hypothetical protein
MEDFLKGRNNPNLPTDELTCALQNICSAFGEGWLRGKEAHPIRHLWVRDDAVATSELFWLGDSIGKLKEISSKWAQWHIGRIKRGDKNERLGSIFEILALGMFCQPGQTVKPASHSSRGYDADITLSDEVALCLSIKSIGASDYQRSAEINSKRLHDMIVKDAQQNSRSWSGITLMGRFYPSDEDWKTANGSVLAFLQNTPAIPATFNLNQQWTLFINAPPRDHLPLDSAQPSHSVQVIVPHHPNEQRNFLNRVARKSQEFHRYAIKNLGRKIYIMLIRLPETASVTLCSRWLSEGFSVTQGNGIDQIFLYQPSALTQT